MVSRHRSRVDSRRIQAIREGPLWRIVRRFTNGEMRIVLEEIKRRKKEDTLRTLLMNYLIIRTVTVFEVFMLNFAERYVREHPEVATVLLKNPKLDNTVGQQLASAYSFLNEEHVNFVFTKFIGKHFFREIRKQSVEYTHDYCYESEHIKWASPLHKNWEKFERIFKLRHKIVHHNKLVNMNWKEYRDMIESVLDFMMCAPLIVPLDYRLFLGASSSSGS